MRQGDWGSALNRWFHRNRPRIAVTAAFAIAGLLGLLAASGLGGETSDPLATMARLAK